LFHNHKLLAPRLLWATWTMLMAEWPTGRKMRHIFAPRSAIPSCRFCGAHKDCFTHWFGPRACKVLFDLSAAHIVLPPYQEYGLLGFITLPVDDVRWFQLMQWFKSILSLLQWGNPEEGFNQSLLIREGTWISRSSADAQRKHTSIASKARAAARNRATRRRKLALKGTLTTCRCGAVHRRGQHNSCVLVSLRFQQIHPAGDGHGGQ
jgi:hypothetical protein